MPKKRSRSENLLLKSSGEMCHCLFRHSRKLRGGGGSGFREKLGLYVCTCTWGIMGCHHRGLMGLEWRPENIIIWFKTQKFTRKKQHFFLSKRL